MTDEAIETAKASDAVLMGSIGGDAKTSPWYQLPPERRPEAGLLKIRKSLNLFANLRPAIFMRNCGRPALWGGSEQKGFDLLIMRELTGGLYFEKDIPERKTEREPLWIRWYIGSGDPRIAVKAFDIARKRNHRSAVWIKPMCWIPPDSGERLWRKWQKNIRT